MPVLASVEVWNRETIESLIPQFGGKYIVVMGHEVLAAAENSLVAQKMVPQEEIDQRSGAIIIDYIPTEPFPNPDSFPSLLVLFEEGPDGAYLDDDDDGHNNDGFENEDVDVMSK